MTWSIIDICFRILHHSLGWACDRGLRLLVCKYDMGWECVPERKTCLTYLVVYMGLGTELADGLDSM